MIGTMASPPGCATRARSGSTPTGTAAACATRWSAGGPVFEGRPPSRRAGRARAARRNVTAGHVVACADRWLPGLSLLEDQVGQVQTFLAVTHPLRDDRFAGCSPTGRSWSGTAADLRYFRLTGDRRLLVGGASLWHTYARRERHDAGRNLRPLAGFLSRTFPGLDVRWDQVWPGMLGVSKDFLPVAGREAEIHPHLHRRGGGAALGGRAGPTVRRIDRGGGRWQFPEFSPPRRSERAAPLSRVLTGQGALALAHGVLVARSL